MAINSDDIEGEIISGQVIQGDPIGSGAGLSLTERALNILNDVDSTQVFGGDTWNQMSNTAGTKTPILNPSGVATGWSITNTIYSENALSLAVLPFYDAGVYGIARMIINSGGAAVSLTISGLNNSAFYTFIFSGGSTAGGAGAGTRVIQITSNVSADTATILTDTNDPTNDHIDQLNLQAPSGGTIILTLTNTNANQAQCSTFEIQEFS